MKLEFWLIRPEIFVLSAALASAVACGSDGTTQPVESQGGTTGNPGVGGSTNVGGSSTNTTSANTTGGGSAVSAMGHRLATHAYGSCALNGTGKMVCWGVIPPNTDSITPTSDTFTAISSGFTGVCALTTTGSMSCFDEPHSNGGTAPLAGTWARVFGGGGEVCAADSKGTVTCSDTTYQPPSGIVFADYSLGQRHHCALRNDTSNLTCWGTQGNPFPSCDQGFEFGQLNPPAGQYVRVTSGWWHSCAIATDGTVQCWGAGTANDTTGFNSCSPAERFNYGQSIPPAGTFKEISAGTYTTCGIRTDGTLACWGAGQTAGDCSSGIDQCGQALAPSGTFVEVSVGNSHACAMTADSKVKCWGSNTGGRSTPPAELQ